MFVPPRTSRASARSRLRMMLRHTWLITIAVSLLCAGLVGAAFYAASRPTTLKIAVGPKEGEDAKFIQAAAKYFETDRINIRLRLVPTEGSIESAKALDGRQADLAVARRDVAIPQSGLAVAVLRKNVAVFLVPAPGSPALGTAKARTGAKAKKIEKLGDLSGRRVGVVSRGIANDGGVNINVNVLNAILKQYEIPADKVNFVILDPDNIAESLKDKPVDAIFAVGPVTARFIADAIKAASSAKAGPTLLAVDAAEAIENRFPQYESTEIKEGVFGGSKPLPDEDVKTIGVSHYLLARRSVSESTIADFTKHLFNARQRLAAEFPGAAKIEKPDTDRDATVPAHPGAAAYLDNDQKTFFDRYSDLLYWGLMAMSVLGSGFAGLLSYSKADDRVRKLHTLERLLEIAKAARSADSIKALDDLQAEIDTIQGDMIHEVEAGTLDETAMMAYAMSVERAQLTISDRRPAVQDLPPRPLAAVASL